MNYKYFNDKMKKNTIGLNQTDLFWSNFFSITNPPTMKSCFFFLALFFSIILVAQNNEGFIIYEDKYNIHRNLPPEMEAMKDRIPEFRTSKKILSFKGQEALYKAYVEEKDEVQEFRGERRWGRWNRPDVNEYYSNMSEKVFIDHQEFFGREFLIDGERDVPKWKITAEQKQVGSYLCQKAILVDTSSLTIAWFTPMIPIMNGPGEFFGLPGAVLHVDVDNGMRMVTAQTIELTALEEEISQPNKGKKVSREEFEKIKEEKQKEMEEMYGDGPRKFWRMRF